MQAILHTPGFVFSFVFVFTLIVFVHEMGHFLAARMLGAKVDVFSIGFGKRLFQRTDRYGTLWQVSLFPIGGYVKFAGDAGAASTPDAKAIEEAQADGETGIFHLLPVWRRAIIVAAGPLMNFFFAIVIFAILLMSFGTRTIPARIDSVESGSPAAEAGFMADDLILKADGRQVNSFSDVAAIVSIAANEPVRFVVERLGETVTLVAVPGLIEQTDVLGNTLRIGYLGIRASTDVVERRHYGPASAIAAGTSRTWNSISDQLKFMGRLVRGRGSVDMLGGPLRIFAYTGAVGTAPAPDAQSAPMSLAMRIVNLINLAALLSVAIGLVNLLPVPVLDGGHLLYYAFEAATGKPLSDNMQLAGFKVGLALILSLMVFATFNDLRYFGLFESISRLFS
ncbi:MAG: RIP metalloprotease RseP [Robiginitomaculum sp.]|nr:MAG: RIP metalloprotease RseP [Robiginitomaculum sp.]